MNNLIRKFCSLVWEYCYPEFEIQCGTTGRVIEYGRDYDALSERCSQLNEDAMYFGDGVFYRIVKAQPREAK